MNCRIYIKQAMAMLSYKKRTSFNKWCRLNKVGIYSDVGSNRHFVLDFEFHNALARCPIRHISNLFNLKKNQDQFYAYMRLTSEVKALGEEKKARNQGKSEYTPEFEHEKEVISRWTKEFGEI